MPGPIMLQDVAEWSEVDVYVAEQDAADADPPDVTPVPPVAAEPQESPAPAENDWHRHPVADKLVLGEEIDPAVVEQYRKLGTALHRVQVEDARRVVMVASAVVGEGKTLTTANLAVTLSESFRQRVLLIDADLRRPTIHKLLKVPNDSGLNDVLKAGHDGKLTLYEVSERLTVLPAGPPNSDPMGGLMSDRMKRILAEAGAKFDWVLLDTPPVGLLPDANVLAEMVDMIVLVVAAGETKYRSIERAIGTLDRRRIVGVVLNRAVQSPTAYRYYAGYAAPISRA